MRGDFGEYTRRGAGRNAAPGSGPPLEGRVARSGADAVSCRAWRNIAMMDADLRRYLAAVKAEEAPASSTDPRWGETEALARRLIAEAKAEAALKLIEQEPARRKRWDLLLLTARLRAGLGDRPLELDALEIVADKLVATSDRSGV